MAPNKAKFMMTGTDEELAPVIEQAKIRCITIQEELRAVMIPEWLAIEKARVKRRKR